MAPANQPLETTLDLAGLLPDGITCVVASHRHHSAPFLDAEAAYVASRAMQPGREQEFRVGRACAREVLQHLGFRDWPLLPGPARDPVWPDAVAGSITHCGGLCAAAATAVTRFAGIGIDIESTARVSVSIAPWVCTSAEMRVLERRDERSARLHLTRIFSAKESAYKAVFSATRQPFDFLDIEIEFDGDKQSFRVQARRAVLDRTVSRLCGRRADWNGFVLTSALLPQ